MKLYLFIFILYSKKYLHIVPNFNRTIEIIDDKIRFGAKIVVAYLSLLLFTIKSLKFKKNV